jgi:acetyltransferase-like isoleucine patch superfamily enzyme
MDWRRRRTIRRALSRLRLPLREDPLLPSGVIVGKHTFAYGVDTFQIFRPGARIEVGSYCSIHRESRIIAGADHVTSRASTFPFNARLFDPGAGNLDEAVDGGTTMIGNDVWVGIGAIILSGVMVGDGAVIGAGAVVSKSVPAYAVVVGNPAQVVRYRFESETRRRLQALAWWHWTEDEICAAREWLTVDVESILDEMEQVHPPVPESELARRLSEVPLELMTPRGARATT